MVAKSIEPPLGYPKPRALGGESTQEQASSFDARAWSLVLSLWHP